MTTEKPPQLFGRGTEWQELTGFADAGNQGATLGLVYGRRRQGKTLMLELLAQEMNGFIFAATQQTETQNLAELGQAYADFVGLRQAVRFSSWDEALAELFRLGEQRNIPVIIDEFPYLVSSSPGLPSILQRALSPLSFAKTQTRTRLILCGSALTSMTQLLSSGAPLRGRATLELIVRPFAFRDAAHFWGVAENPELAFRLNALVGGTPAYLEMCGGSGPKNVADFDKWVCQRLLNPASAMFREGNLILREEPSIMDSTSYTAVLSALANGSHRRSEIAATLGRPSSSLGHLLSGLADIGLVEQVDDAIRNKRTVFHLAEPAVRIHQLVISRHEPELVAGRAERVWKNSGDTITGKIYGPHFEKIARDWCFDHASEETLGGVASLAQPSEIACREHKRGHELDVVVLERKTQTGERITAIGEAKCTSAPIGIGQLERLEHLRDLLPQDRVVGPVKLLLFSRSGFTAELTRAAISRSDVELVDMERLYHGD